KLRQLIRWKTDWPIEWALIGCDHTDSENGCRRKQAESEALRRCFVEMDNGQRELRQQCQANHRQPLERLRPVIAQRDAVRTCVPRINDLLQHGSMDGGGITAARCGNRM